MKSISILSTILLFFVSQYAHTSLSGLVRLKYFTAPSSAACKILVSLTFAFTLLPFALFSQWEIQSPLPTGNHMNDIFFTDSLNGWVVCNYSYYYHQQDIILHTSDGGQTRVGQECVTNESLNSVFFHDNMQGWAVGTNGIVIKTTDGGEHWDVISTLSGEELRSVVFVNELEGTAVGYEGTVIKTSDGGNTWRVIPMNTTASLRQVMFVSEDEGWIVGNNDTSLVFHTQNGGNTWNLIYSMCREDHWYSSVYFTSPENGWLIENFYYYGPWFPIRQAYIKHTNDGGATWTVQDTCDECLLEFTVFADSLTGWCAGDNQVFRTTDGGNTWEASHVEQESIMSICNTGKNNVWIIGHDFIYSSEDGGNGWQEQLNIIKGSFFSVSFIDDKKGWAVGNKLYHTNDGGLNWEVQNDTVNGSSICFTDKNHGWIATRYDGKIYRTSDGGEHWILGDSITNRELRTIFFTDSLNGWVAGGNYSNESILYGTKDGGVTWIQQDGLPRPLYSIYFTDKDHGWAAGGHHVLYTQDGGDNWDYTNVAGPYDAYLYTVFFIDNLTGWTAGSDGKVFKTTDGGVTWERKYTNVDCQFKTIFFTDADHGWVAGGDYHTDAMILYTEDGGETWEVQVFDFGRWFTSLSFPDPDHGWAVGFAGTIMYLDNGGTVGNEEFEVRSPGFEVACYPNPFQSYTTIEYNVQYPDQVEISIFNQPGQQIEYLVQSIENKGTMQHTWNTEGYDAGIYYCRIQSGNQSETIKMMKY